MKNLVKYKGEYSVEAYAQLFNACPITMIVTPEVNGFLVGYTDSNANFVDHARFATRTEAMRYFGGLCAMWANR